MFKRRPEDVKIVVCLNGNYDLKDLERILADSWPYMDLVLLGKNSIGLQAIGMARNHSKDVIAGLEIYDEPIPAANKVTMITGARASFYTIMPGGGVDMMKAVLGAASLQAKINRDVPPKAIAILDSWRIEQLDQLKIFFPGESTRELCFSRQRLEFIVNALAKLAVEAGIGCAWITADYVEFLKQRWPQLTVFANRICMPGSSLDGLDGRLTPAKAVKAGADYLVMSDPILYPPKGKTRKQVAAEIRADIARAFEE